MVFQKISKQENKLALVVVLAVASQVPWARSQAPTNEGGAIEPDWVPILHGDPTTQAFTIDTNTQVWTSVPAGSDAPLCRYSSGSANSGAGVCRTDVGWLTAAYDLAGIDSFNSATNYLLRFRLQEACYKSTVYSANLASVYCAEWYLDDSLVGQPGESEAKKIEVNDICYTNERNITTPEGLKLEKYGCSHYYNTTFVPTEATVTIKETPVERNNWYVCKNRRLTGDKREECEDTAFALNTGVNATLLKDMVRLLKGPGNKCHEAFAAGMADYAGEETNNGYQNFCQVTISGIAQRQLEELQGGAIGTPLDPVSLDPIYQPPPPMPPSSPPLASLAPAQSTSDSLTPSDALQRSSSKGLSAGSVLLRGAVLAAAWSSATSLL